MTPPHVSAASVPSLSSPRSHLERSFRNVLRRFIVLAAGLLIVSLPGLALAEEHMTEEDDDPFDRPGFYVGVGGTYQRNVFESRIEDVVQDELQGTLLADTKIDIDDSGGVNAVVGYRAWSWFALELQYEWIDEYEIAGSVDLGPFGTQSGDLYSIESHTLTANTKWIIPFWRIQPYILAGVGYAVYDVDRGSIYDNPLVEPILTANGVVVDDGTHHDFAARAGGGVDFYVTENIVVNAQASVVLTTLEKPEIGDIDDLNYIGFAAGLQYRF